MSISTTNPDLMRAILAMDAYNRGYNSGIGPVNGGLGGVGSQIGLATVIRQEGGNNAQAASFFAQAYSFGTGAEVGAALRYYGDMTSNPS